eukprot:SAG11_NODE_822_length_7009_cov_7.776122_3_plen_151_part_00
MSGSRTIVRAKIYIHLVKTTRACIALHKASDHLRSKFWTVMCKVNLHAGCLDGSLHEAECECHPHMPLRAIALRRQRHFASEKCDSDSDKMLRRRGGRRHHAYLWPWTTGAALDASCKHGFADHRRSKLQVLSCARWLSILWVRSMRRAK